MTADTAAQPCTFDPRSRRRRLETSTDFGTEFRSRVILPRRLINLHPNGLFSGDYISPLRGAAPWNFSRAKDWQALLAHTPRWDGVPPPKKIFDRENLKFGLKFSVLRSIPSGLVAISSRYVFQSTSRGTVYTRPVPKNLWRQKIVQNSARFLTTYDFVSRISPERVNISKIRKAHENLQLPRWTKKSLCTLVHKRKS